MDRELLHPDDPKKIVPARFPGEGRDLKFEPGEDRRERLANWLTSSNNPYFARTIVNRIWKEFMGLRNCGAGGFSHHKSRLLIRSYSPSFRRISSSTATTCVI